MFASGFKLLALCLFILTAAQPTNNYSMLTKMVKHVYARPTYRRVRPNISYGNMAYRITLI